MNLQEAEEKKDEEVIALVLKDKEFFGVLVRRYESRLTKYVRRIAGVSREMNEDIVQNIFIKAFVNINSFQKGKNFGSWLYGIAHNECIDNWRKYRKHAGNVSLDGNEELFAILASKEDIEQSLIKKDRKDSINNALKRLPVKFREVLVLKYLEDKSYEEVGYILKKPVSTVGTLLNRAKKRFKKILSENK